MSNSQNILFQYWGKADPGYAGQQKWHPLLYHMLDVAAVAAAWWDACPALRGRFLVAFRAVPEKSLRAWVLFFVALHDLGKADLRFQLKAPDALAAAWRVVSQGNDHEISPREISTFDHGHAGLAWAAMEYQDWLGMDNRVIDPARLTEVGKCQANTHSDYAAWSRWVDWLTAVTGHHGDFQKPGYEGLKDIEADDTLIVRDRTARGAIVTVLEQTLLRPEGLSLHADWPPICAPPVRALLAGFCATCDWLGSNTTVFDYCVPSLPPQDYLSERCAKIESTRMLTHYGLLAIARRYSGLPTLLGGSELPRGVQTMIDDLPATAGLTLIEAPTGSGKTEAALAHAWRLLDSGVADGIVFALPTQATANAMFERVKAFAAKAYGDANVVLAHGKRDFNVGFRQLIERGQHRTSQGDTEASVQCASWLASSRKRVFLGQIGVCTVDQVLLSVLPVRHQFVRGFGLTKSVLIVDEVHAYDAYMYGLLGEVLKNQCACGGSAILLSATLSTSLRNKLLASWNSHAADSVTSAPYPALWHAMGGLVAPLTVTEAHRPPRREVSIECLRLDKAFPDDNLLSRVVDAAVHGALVAIIVNLVDDAQRLARILHERTSQFPEIKVDIFHARYRFTDRQEKEAAVLQHYGRTAERTKGRILVATQVVEQSLDLDFDWLVTQICPVDLLFQRLGRLHRHQRKRRPSGFETPHCTVLTVERDDYGVFELIYGNARVLWRTDMLLNRERTLVFPEAYRAGIEQVYQYDDWSDEPEKIACNFTLFSAEQIRRERDAQRLTSMTVACFRDEDGRIASLTRDGEMSLSVLPMTASGCLLDGQRIKSIANYDQPELINLNVVPSPASWAKRLCACPKDSDGPLTGIWQMIVTETAPGVWRSDDGQLMYSKDFGMEKC